MKNRKTILCKLLGSLVLIEVTAIPNTTERTGTCPVCKGTTFSEGSYGWVDCEDCGQFSFNKSQYDKIMKVAAAMDRLRTVTNRTLPN